MSTKAIVRESSCSGGDSSSRVCHGSVSSTSRVNVILRALVLFFLGALLAFVLNVLQMEYRVHNLLAFFQLNWWVIPVCGLAAIYIGFCYPFFDHKFGECHYNDRDWTLIIRSFALFIGLNHLTARIQFASSYHFLMILIVFCIVFWYWFDKTKFGLLFNMFNSFSVLAIVHVLKYFGFFNFSEIQFTYIRICLLCLIFSGGVTFGNIGRLLEFSFLFKYERQASSRPHID